MRLPSAPGIVVRILDIVKRDDFSFHQLGSVIQGDPALVTRILRLVNSGFYALPNKIASIDTATVILGVNAVKNIALSFSIPNTFQTQADGFTFNLFWKRSAIAATAAEMISVAAKAKNDEVFITALLQDIGIATMFTCNKENYKKVLDQKKATGQTAAVIEREIFGFDHAEVGSELLKEWGLPERVYAPILYHHNTENAPPALKKICNILRASDYIAKLYCGTGNNTDLATTKEILSKTFGFDEAQIDALIDGVAERSIDLLSQLEVDTDMRPYSELLQDANKELSLLNLSYERLLLEYRGAKENAERLTVELRVANARLQELAFRDGLTGLYNHRYFQEAVDKEMARAECYGRPVTLIMVDLDNFKTINDTYGHQRGDIVLQAVSRQIEQISRKTDVVSRYGGEEFMVILPETSRTFALRKAEEYRSVVENMEVLADGIMIRITISVGVVTYNPTQDTNNRDKLIRLADAALYKSKQSGRNRVTP